MRRAPWPGTCRNERERTRSEATRAETTRAQYSIHGRPDARACYRAGLVSARHDPIAVVEACYDLSASEEQWLQGIADTALPLIRGVGLLAYHVDLDERGPLFQTPVQAGGQEEALARIQEMAALLERQRAGTNHSFADRVKARIYTRVVRGGVLEPADVMLLADSRHFGPKWMYTLGVPGVREVFHLRSHHIDGNGVTMLVAGLSDERPLRPSERRMYQMLSAHIKAGLRLRRRLPQVLKAVAASADGAILDAAAHVVHAEGEAKEHSAREELEAMARAIDKARSKKTGRDESALEVWQGLVSGRWSLIEQFDQDGKRFVLAHRNPESVTDPRGLTSMEARVAGLAVRGYSNKLIAYHLGVSEGTVSSHLARAMVKLKVENRSQLLRTLGAFYGSTSV